MKTLSETRSKYLNSKDPEERRSIAKQEIEAWKQYVDSRWDEMPDYMKISKRSVTFLNDHFPRFTERLGTNLKAERVLEFHHSIVDSDRYFNVPLHGKNLAQLVHPYWGYLQQFRVSINS